MKDLRDAVLLYLGVWIPLVLVFGNMADRVPTFGAWFHAAIIGSALWWFLSLPAGLWLSELVARKPMNKADEDFYLAVSILIVLPLTTSLVRYQLLG